MAEITVNQLNKYYSDFHLLQDISFEVYPGQRVGIVGPNGCGKTTLFNILTGKEPYDSGELSLREGARVALLDQLYWVAGSLAGSLVGGLLPFDTTGIDFSMTALFLVVMTEQWRAARDHTAALVGLGVSLACLAVFGADNFLIPAMVGITLALTLLRRRPGAPEQEGAHASH